MHQYQRTVGWWGKRTGELVFMSSAAAAIYFGFGDYVMVLILYAIWLAVGAVVDSMRGIRDGITMDSHDVARDIAERLARSRTAVKPNDIPSIGHPGDPN